ncbi:hypothetical protein J5839_02330 [Methanosarcinaceae archaeon]|nr:hypothetical protein [Methanosarcinaceae archaeon]
MRRIIIGPIASALFSAVSLLPVSADVIVPEQGLSGSVLSFSLMISIFAAFVFLVLFLAVVLVAAGLLKKSRESTS